MCRHITKCRDRVRMLSWHGVTKTAGIFTLISIMSRHYVCIVAD